MSLAGFVYIMMCWKGVDHCESNGFLIET